MSSEVIELICRSHEYSSLRKAQLVMVEMIKVVDEICKKHNLTYWIDSGTLLGAIRHDGFIPWDDDADLCMPREDYDKFLALVEKELPEHLALETESVNLHKKLPWARLLYTKNFKWKFHNTGEEHMGLSIDIFPMDLVDYNTPNKKLVNILSRICSSDKPQKIKDPKALIKSLLLSVNFKKYWVEYVNDLNGKGKGEYFCYGIETSFTNSRFLFHKEDIFPLKKATFENYEFSIPNNYDKYLTNLYGDYMRIPPENERMTHCTEFEII